MASLADRARRWREAWPPRADAEPPTGPDNPAPPASSDEGRRFDLRSLRPGATVWTAGRRYVGTSKGAVRAPDAAARHRFALRPTWRRAGDRQRYHLIDPDWDATATDGSAEFVVAACGARIAPAGVKEPARAGAPPGRACCANCAVVVAKVAREGGGAPPRCADCGRAISASAKRCVRCHARYRVSPRYRLAQQLTASR